MFLLSSADLHGTNKTGFFFFFYLFFQVHLLQVLISRKYEVLGQKSIEMTNYTNKTNLKLKFYRVVSAHKKINLIQILSTFLPVFHPSCDKRYVMTNSATSPN